MKLKHKKSIAVLGAATMAISLAACSGTPNDNTNNGEKEVTLQWGFWDTGAEKTPIWQGLAADVTKKYPNIKVELTTPPFADYFTKLQSQLAGGNAPCIVSMQSLRLPTFAEVLEPLDELMKAEGVDAAEFDGGAMKALQLDGKQYAIPYGFSSLVMFYNKDMFKSAGIAEPAVDWTIADFEETAKKLTEATGKPGFGLSFSDLHMFSLLYANNGAKPVNAEGKLDLSTPEMKESFAWYTDLALKHKVASVPASASDIPWGEQQFVAGNVGMAVDGSWNLASNATSANFNVGIVPLPQGANGGGTFSANSGFGIAKNCADKSAAMKAIAVITGADGQKAAASKGSQPARLDASQEFYDYLAESIDSKTAGFAEQAKGTLEAASASATPFVSASGWDQITKQIARQFILAYTGSETPDAVLEAVQQTAK